MPTQINLRKIMNTVAGAALFAALSLSPIGASAAFANSPGEHSDSASEMADDASEMAQNSGMADDNDDNDDHPEDNSDNKNDNADDNGDNADDKGDNSDNKGDNSDDKDDNADDSEEHKNSRPMNLNDFMDSLDNGTSIAETERSNHQIRVEYSDGWEEKIENDRYELRDPNGNVIISRASVQIDLDRLNSAF